MNSIRLVRIVLAIIVVICLYSRNPTQALAGSVLVSNPAWQFIGPSPIQNAQSNFGGPQIGPLFPATGRLTSLAADPNDPGRFFVGAAGGGMWMTTDGGNTFAELSSALPTYPPGDPSLFPLTTVGAVTLDPTASPPTLYLATGEGNESIDSYWGNGFFKSTDLGQTWSPATVLYNSQGQFLSYMDALYQGYTRVAVDSSHTPPYIYAGTTYTSGSNRSGASNSHTNFLLGLYRSTDGAQTFSQYPASVFGSCSEFVTFPEGGANISPCPVNDVVVDPSTHYVFAAVESYGVFRSTDSGSTWASINNIPGVTNGQPGLGRISLAASGGTVYAMVGQNLVGSPPTPTQTFLGFFSSTDSGTTWATRSVPCASVSDRMGDSAIIDGTFAGAPLSVCGPSTFSQQFYDQALAIAPGAPNTVAFGGVGVYTSTDAGNTWNFTGIKGGIHSDVHALQFDPFDPNALYAATDGGLYEINLVPLSVSSLNLSSSGPSLSAAQLYNISPHPVGSSTLSTDVRTAIAGLQDNGTGLWSSGAWSQVDTGDASFALFDLLDPAFAYHDFLNGGLSIFPRISFSNNSGGSGTWNSTIPSGGIDTALANAKDAGAGVFPPVASDPATPDRLLLGAHFVYVSTDNMQSWSQQSTRDLTNGCSNGNCAIEDIEFAPSDPTKGRCPNRCWN